MRSEWKPRVPHLLRLPSNMTELRALRGRNAIDQGIETERARARHRQIQKDEAEQDRAIAAIDRRIDARRRMEHPIRDRHLAGGDEGCRTRQKPDNEQRAGDDLNKSANSKQAKQSLLAWF